MEVLLFFTHSRVNTNIWCLGLLWLDMHSHHTAANLFLPSYYCSQIKPSYFASMLNSILVFTASSPPAACTEFHTKPLVYISAAIKPRPRREVPQRVAEVQGWELIFNFCDVARTHPFALGKKNPQPDLLTPHLSSCVFLGVYFAFGGHFGTFFTSWILFPNWPVKSFSHAEIISRAKLGNLRQLGNLTAGWTVACNKRQCE